MFTGRADILEELEGVIRDFGKDFPQQKSCHIGVTGIGGQGKSELSRQLVQRLETCNLLCDMFWIDVSSAAQAEKDYLKIVQGFDLRASTWEDARQLIAELRRSWLLVLDNADDPNTDYTPYYPPSPYGVVILTSRNIVQSSYYGTSKHVKLEGLAVADAQNLLFEMAGTAAERRTDSGSDALDVARLLHFHPLALIQAGVFIGEGHCSLREYPLLLKSKRKELLSFQPSAIWSRCGDLYSTFDESVKRLELMGTCAADDSLQLLGLLAIFGPGPLPMRLFDSARAGALAVLIDDVAESDLHALGQWHMNQLASFLELEIDSELWRFRTREAVTLLWELCLVSTDGNGQQMRCSMHPLVHAWAGDRLTSEQQHSYWIQSASLIAFSLQDTKLWLQAGEPLQQHLRAIVSWSKRITFCYTNVMDICRILFRCRQLLECKSDTETRLAVVSRIFSLLDQHPDYTKKSFAMLLIQALVTKEIMEDSICSSEIDLLLGHCNEPSLIKLIRFCDDRNLEQNSSWEELYGLIRARCSMVNVLAENGQMVPMMRPFLAARSSILEIRLLSAFHGWNHGYIDMKNLDIATVEKIAEIVALSRASINHLPDQLRRSNERIRAGVHKIADMYEMSLLQSLFESVDVLKS